MYVYIYIYVCLKQDILTTFDNGDATVTDSCFYRYATDSDSLRTNRLIRDRTIRLTLSIHAICVNLPITALSLVVMIKGHVTTKRVSLWCARGTVPHGARITPRITKFISTIAYPKYICWQLCDLSESSRKEKRKKKRERRGKEEKRSQIRLVIEKIEKGAPVISLDDSVCSNVSTPTDVSRCHVLSNTAATFPPFFSRSTTFSLRTMFRMTRDETRVSGNSLKRLIFTIVIFI